MKSQYWLLKIKEMTIFIIFIKIYFLKNDFRGSVILENRFSGKMFIRPNVHSAKCPFWKMSFRGNVHSANCTFWQVSIQRNVFLESVFQRNVFLGGVRIPSLKT